MNLQSKFAMLLLALVSGTASAGGVFAPLSEPGILELLAVGAVVGVAIAIRKRWKK